MSKMRTFWNRLVARRKADGTERRDEYERRSPRSAVSSTRASKTGRRTPPPRSGSAAAIRSGCSTTKVLHASEEEPMPRRLLVVITTEVADGVLRDLVRRRVGDDAEMLVVAPASDISRLDWLTNAEDDSRTDAASLA